MEVLVLIDNCMRATFVMDLAIHDAFCRLPWGFAQNVKMVCCPSTGSLQQAAMGLCIVISQWSACIVVAVHFAQESTGWCHATYPTLPWGCLLHLGALLARGGGMWVPHTGGLGPSASACICEACRSRERLLQTSWSLCCSSLMARHTSWSFPWQAWLAPV